MTRPTKRILARTVTAAITLHLLAGCAVWGPEGGPGAAGGAAPTLTPTRQAAAAMLGADGIQRIEISIGDDLRLTPDTVTARPGIIEFTFRNTGVTPHDIGIESPASGGSGNVNGGATQTVRVEITTPGVYPMPCRYHHTSGMTGTLTIAPTIP